MNERIKQLAEQAGFPERRVFSDLSDLYPRLERFANLVASAEREACAKVCDDISATYKWPQDTAEKVASQWCADRIRARSNT